MKFSSSKAKLLKLIMWRKKRKTTSHTVSTLNWWGDVELYDLFMQGSPRSIFFLSFFPTKFFYSHFYIKTAALYQFHVSSFRDLPKVKRHLPGETHILFYFVYSVFFILFLLLLFAVVVFFGRLNVHTKRRKLIWQQTTFSGQLHKIFRALRVSDEGVVISTNQSAVFQHFFRFQHHLAMTKCINNKVGRGHLCGGRFAWSQINIPRIVLFLFLCQERICSRSPDKNKSTYN